MELCCTSSVRLLQPGLLLKVSSQCLYSDFHRKDTQCKDILDIWTKQLINNHCILRAVTSLSKDNSI